MKAGFVLITTFFIGFTLSSCSKKGKEGHHIPVTASLAMQVNVKSLSSKLPWSEIKKHTLFTNAYNAGSEWIKNLLDSPAVSGIDTDKGIFFFAQGESNGGYIAIEGNIKDEAAFKTFCSRMLNNTESIEEDGIHYISRFPDCVGWSSKEFIYITDAPQIQRMDDLNRRMLQDSIDISNHTPRDVKATCKNLFELEDSKSLASDDTFSSLLEEQGDLHVWANTEIYFRDIKPEGVFAFINLEKLYKESTTTATVSFEKGQINIHAHSFFNAALSKVFEKFTGGKVSDEMLKRIPGNKVDAALAINYKPEGLHEIAKTINLDGIINTYSPMLGFTVSDFIKANKGDILLSVADFKMIADTNPLEEMKLPFAMNKPSFNAIFAASVAEKNTFDKLYTAGGKAVALLLNTSEYPIFNSYNDKYLVLGNSKAGIDAFMNSPAANTHDFTNKIDGSPLGSYVNLQSLLKLLAEQNMGNKAIYEASLKLWDNMLLKGGDFENGALNFTLEINMTDKNTNSLQQLNNYLATIADVTEQQRKKELENMRTLQDAFPVEEIPSIK